MVCRNQWRTGRYVTVWYRFTPKASRWRKPCCIRNCADLLSSTTCTCSTNCRTGLKFDYDLVWILCLQCFDAVGWVAGRASGVSGEVLAWLSVWSEVYTCIPPSWCHCHSLSLASVKSRLVFAFLVPAHPGSPGKRSVKRVCVCVCVCVGLNSVLLRASHWMLTCVYLRMKNSIAVLCISVRQMQGVQDSGQCWHWQTSLYGRQSRQPYWRSDTYVFLILLFCRVTS